MARLFFAIWADAPAAEKLEGIARDVARDWGGKPVRPGNLHLTLAFLGEVAESRVEAAREAAGSVEASAFELRLDVIGNFPGARVAWAAPASLPAGLAQLASRLEAALRDRGFEAEARAFVPHLTLARKIESPGTKRSMATIGWPVREFVLARTEFGAGRYALLGAWPLGENRE